MMESCALVHPHPLHSWPCMGHMHVACFSLYSVQCCFPDPVRNATASKKQGTVSLCWRGFVSLTLRYFPFQNRCRKREKGANCAFAEECWIAHCQQRGRKDVCVKTEERHSTFTTIYKTTRSQECFCLWRNWEKKVAVCLLHGFKLLQGF